MRGSSLHLVAADQLVGQRLCVRPVDLPVQRLRVLLGLLRLSGVPAEGDVRSAGQQLAESFHLVVGQGVHRVEEESPDTGAQSSGGLLAQ